MPTGGNVDATHAPVGGGGLYSICKLWRPWWLKVLDVREGRACARPRTVKVSPPYRSTQSFKENHHILPLNRYLRILARSLSRRGFHSGQYSGHPAAHKNARLLRLEMNYLIHLQTKTKEKFHHAGMVIHVYVTPENKHYELPNPRPMQCKKIHFFSPNPENK